MSYARAPSAEEYRELKRMTRQEIGRVSQRAQMVLLDGQGRTAPEIARILDTTALTVRFWLRRFDTEGPGGLYDEPRSGRPRKVTTEVGQSIDALIRDDPEREGYVATFWTVAMLVLVVCKKLRLRVSASTMRGTLRALGLRWGRPRLGMPGKVDPAKAHKQWLLAQTVIAAGPEAVILYADESRVQLWPLLRAMWHWVGHQVRVPTPGSNQWRALFGALNIRTGQWTHIVRERMHQEDFIVFLEHLLVVYPTEVIVLIVDNYRSHTAGAVTEWRAEHPRLHLLYLPKYCSHLNPVEQLWLRMKNEIAPNRLYGSMQLLLDAVAKFFSDMSPEQALEWASA